MSAAIDCRKIPPEQTLLLAAVQTSASTSDHVDRALRAGPDWTRLVELTLQHRMAPALLPVLERADTALVPADLLAALGAHCERLRGQGEAVTRELVELLDVLAARSIAAVPFKGPVLGAFLFGDAGLRAPGDVDLLIRRESVQEVCAVLETRGYADAGRKPGAARLTPVQQRMYEQFQCEYQFVRKADDMVVEPHWGLSQRPLALDVDYAGMLDRARAIPFGGGTALSLAPEDLLLALCVHGSKHRWVRLAWIRDVAALLEKCPEMDLAAVVTRARDQGLGRLLLLALSIVQACAEAPLPVGLAQSIRKDGTLVALRAEILAGLFGPPVEEPRNDRVDRFRFRVRERWADRLRYVGRTLVTPRREHLEVVRLPNRLRGGYYVIKIGIDFALAPMWRLLKSLIVRKRHVNAR